MAKVKRMEGQKAVKYFEVSSNKPQNKEARATFLEIRTAALRQNKVIHENKAF